ncbi:hypothetical protein [Gaopeijia maritima]|uniref:Uncharacterized protein n=1 Tax=Gaopeijia maritima TaxID=3119007 RepID=A0ABU9E9N4_9BACT
MMARGRIPLESWEAVVPGVVFPLLGLWLGGSTWTDRAMAGAVNLAPLVVMALLARFGGRRVPAIQGAASVAYGIVAAGWVGHQWDLPGFGLVGAHAEMYTPLAAAALAIVLYPLIALGMRAAGVGPSGTPAQGEV